MIVFNYDYCDNFNKNSSVVSNLLFKREVFNKEEAVFSILIPTFRRANLLENCFLHAAKQTTDKNYEIIICDNDNEKDNLESKELIERLCGELKLKNNVNVYFYKNESNLGQIGNWNRLLELASGKYVLMSHDDDWVDEKILKTSEKYLNKGMGIAFKIKTKDFRKKQTFKQNIRKAMVFTANLASLFISSRKARPLSAYDIFIRYMNPGNCGVIFEREKIIALGGYSQEIFPFSDLHMFTTYILKYGVIFVKKSRAFYRIAQNESITAALKFPLYRYYYMKSMIPFIENKKEEELLEISKGVFIYFVNDASTFWGAKKEEIIIPEDIDMNDPVINKKVEKIAFSTNLYATRRYK